MRFFLGYINEKVLGILQDTSVTRILLTFSMITANGLNLVGDAIFSGASLPSGLLHIHELICSKDQLSAALMASVILASYRLHIFVFGILN